MWSDGGGGGTILGVVQERDALQRPPHGVVVVKQQSVQYFLVSNQSVVLSQSVQFSQ